MKKKQQLYVLTVLGIILAGVVGFFGYRYYVDQKNNAATVVPAGTKSTTAVNQLNADQKTENTPTVTTPVQTKPSTTTTTVADNLATLPDASLTAYLYAQGSVASDGTTAMPAGSVAPFFYVPSGSYTVQKLTDGAWKDVITNQSYPGHGGIAAWFFGPTEDNVSYRVLKVENGKPVSASKTFVVKRSDLTGGVHTYN